MNQTTTTMMITAKNLKPGMVVIMAKGNRRIVNDIVKCDQPAAYAFAVELVDADFQNFPKPRWINADGSRLFKVEVGT